MHINQVFSLVLNWSINLRAPMCSGNSFHSVGTESENTLAANATLLNFGTVSSIALLLDLKFSLVFCLMVTSSWRYTGAELCLHLNVRVNILYCIHWSIGSQWSVLSASVELEYWDLFSAILAQMFWIIWNLCNILSYKYYYNTMSSLYGLYLPVSKCYNSPTAVSFTFIREVTHYQIIDWNI